MTLQPGLRGLAGAFALAALASPALAHGVVGNRFFPATLSTDDPAVADELSLPTISVFRTDDGSREADVSGEYSKRITPSLGISVGTAWSRVRMADGSRVQGFQNLETTLKYQVLTDAEREAIVSVGLGAEWGGTGAGSVGAERVTAVAPRIYFGKGFGDLPESVAWARPFAITGVAAYNIPVRGHSESAGVDPSTGLPVASVEDTTRSVSWGLALEYSLPYLRAHVRDLGLPEFVDRLTPVVEASFESPVGRGGGFTTGTINPGVIWSARRFQVGAEAIVPVNRYSGKDVGFQMQFHLFLDDLFPRSIGRPLFGRRS